MSIEGNEAKGVSVIITSEEDINTLNKLLDEFVQYSVCKERSIAALYALWEISGNLRRGNDGFTFLTPNGITYIPNDGNPEKAWEIEMSKEFYAIARRNISENIEFEKSNTWSQILGEVTMGKVNFKIWDNFSIDHMGPGCQYK